MKLQQIVKEREKLLEQCYIRMERGEAPSTELEQEWQKKQRNEIQRTHDKQMALQVNCLRNNLNTSSYFVKCFQIHKNIITMIIKIYAE